MDLAELHQRNNLNLCLMGGMSCLLSLIYTHEAEEVRRAACSLVTSIVTNNRQVQEFASKSGIINLVGQFDREENIAVKSSVFSCLTAWLKADNFEGKRRFLSDQQGLEFLTRLVTEAAEDANYNARLRLNIHRLVDDLVLNDDGIFEEQPFYVREHLGQHEEFLRALAQELSRSNLQNARDR